MHDNNLCSSNATEDPLELHEIEVSAWAIGQTRENGSFTLQTETRGISLSDEVIDRVVSKLLREGLVEATEGDLYRWVDVPSSPAPRKPGSKRLYTVEERAETIRDFSAWAAEETARLGKFTQKQAQKESGLPSSAATRALRLLVGDGRVTRLEGDVGYRWTDAEIPTALSARRANSRYTTEEWTSLRTDVESWSKAFASFSANQVCKHFKIGATTASRLIDQFVAEGRLVKLDVQRGYAWLGAVLPQDSLGDLIVKAKTLVTDGPTTRRGRLRKDEVHDVTSITSIQHRKLLTLANFIAKSLGYDSPSQVPLSDPVFQWDDERQESALVEAVNAWTAALPGTSRSALRGNVSLLLALAKAYHMKPASVGRQGNSSTTSFAAEWQTEIDRVGPAVVAWNKGKCAESLVTGLRTLARFATRRGELDLGSTTWPAIHLEIERSHEAGGMSKNAWYYARRTYEGLRELGLVVGPPWVEQKERIALLPDSACQDAAGALDFSGWVDTEGNPLAVIEGLYGLEAYCEWATREAWELTVAGLPPRVYIDPNPAQQSISQSNARRGKEDFRLVYPTLLTRLQQINYLLGWIRINQPDIDVATLTLEELCDARLVNKLAESLRKRSKNPRETGYRPIVRTIANQLAVIASPFLEARIRQLSPADTARADAIRVRAAALRQLAVAAKKKTIRRKDIKKIARAWRGSDRVDGWIKLRWLRDLIIREVEIIGGAPLAVQLELLERGEFAVTPDWALKVRSAVLVNLVRLIPLRRRTVSELTLDMWVNEPVLPGEHGRDLNRWEGAIILELPGSVMKSGRDSDPAYISETRVGRQKWEDGAARELLALWFAEGGARDEVRRLPGGQLVQSSYVFPAFARAALNGEKDDIENLEERQCRWAAEDASEHFANLVCEYASRLNIDLARVTELGGLRLHTVRLLFGSYWAPRRLLEASRLLDHRDVNFTARVYCGDGVRQATREAPSKDDTGLVAGRSRDTQAPAWADRLMEELAVANRRAEEAERRLAELLSAKAA